MKKFISASFLMFTIIFAQPPSNQNKELKFVFEPDSISLNVGESKNMVVRLVDSKGKQVNNQFMVRGQRRALSVEPRMSDSTGVSEITVQAYKSGKLSIRAYARGVKGGYVSGQLEINVPSPPLDRVVFVDPNKKVYTGTNVNYEAQVFDKANLLREEVEVNFSTNNEKIAEFDRFGNLTVKRTGRFSITARAENINETIRVKADKNPAKSLSLKSPKNEIRTGDVITLDAKLLNSRGQSVKGVPISFSYTGRAIYSDVFINNKSSESVGLPASGTITNQGKFVAETPGIYTITAQSSGYSAITKVKVVPRNVKKRIEVVGHGTVTDHHTSDLWVWPGVGKHKGKDFAVTGTHSADGEAYFWDISDPSKMKIIDTVKVDARTVNDVKISENGRVGIISREGASNRKNGLVILDVTDPYNVKITKMYDDDLTGGVHNVFIYQDHVYALSAGTRYDVINISDPANPFRVSSYELDTPGHSIHDVWVENGIAYSSNWADGVHIVDVGGLPQSEQSRDKKNYNPFLALAGKGSPGNPIKIASKSDPNGHNHATFPFVSQSSDKFYMINGDEWAKSIPGSAERIYQGGFHFIDFTDINNPVETAIYQIPEVGSHNHWVEGDILYAGYYYGGIRVLDISGELLGDLYAQGREIAFFEGRDPNGKIANETNVWGVIPYKGLIYFADHYNGLWAVRLVDNEPMGTN